MLKAKTKAAPAPAATAPADDSAWRARSPQTRVQPALGEERTCEGANDALPLRFPSEHPYRPLCSALSTHCSALSPLCSAPQRRI